MRYLMPFLVTATIFLSATVTYAQPCNRYETVKLLPIDGIEDGRFGESVAISGTIAVIGAYRDKDSENHSGSAYVYRYDGSQWILEEKLHASDGASNDLFGSSVAISGNIAVIGAKFDDDNGIDSGSAYVFRYDGSSWIQEAKLLASDGAANYQFGYTVTIANNTVVIGSPMHGVYGSVPGSKSGAAYVFHFDGTKWIQEAKLLASDAALEDYFGRSLAISGNIVVIGAVGDDDNGDTSGSAYVFRFDGAQWVQEAKLLASDGGVTKLFGRSVGVSGDTIIIGQPLDRENGIDFGSAYVFRYDGSGWVQETKILAFDWESGRLFGTSVAIDGDKIIVGAFYAGIAPRSGSVYVLQYDGLQWVHEGKLVSSDGNFGDSFGALGLAISGNVVLSGAVYDDDNGSNSGSAYIFDFTDPHPGPQTAKLFLPNEPDRDNFGISVAISNSTVIVGATGEAYNRTDSGSAYLIDTSTCLQTDKITPIDGAAGDVFGSSVAISGTHAIIGAPGDDDNGPDSGSAYLFGVTTGQQEFKLLAGDGAAGDEFGFTVAISGTTAIVGAPKSDDNGTDSGSVYIFDIMTGHQLAKILPDDGAAGDAFGSSVSISGTTAIIGSPGDDDNGLDSGSAYLFDTTRGLQIEKLLPGDGGAGDEFGFSVGISGPTVIVGAPGDFEILSFYGSAYLFDSTKGRQNHKLIQSNGQQNDSFGYSVAISGSTAIVGIFRDELTTMVQTAYLFDTTTGVQKDELRALDGAPHDWFGSSVAIDVPTAIVGAFGSRDFGPLSGSAYLFNAGSTLCIGDLNRNGEVNAIDLQQLLGDWGSCADCTSDINGNGKVNVTDLLALLAAWGPCP